MPEPNCQPMGTRQFIDKGKEPPKRLALQVGAYTIILARLRTTRDYMSYKVVSHQPPIDEDRLEVEASGYDVGEVLYSDIPTTGANLPQERVQTAFLVALNNALHN